MLSDEIVMQCQSRLDDAAADGMLIPTGVWVT